MNDQRCVMDDRLRMMREASAARASKRKKAELGTTQPASELGAAGGASDATRESLPPPGSAATALGPGASRPASELGAGGASDAMRESLPLPGGAATALGPSAPGDGSAAERSRGAPKRRAARNRRGPAWCEGFRANCTMSDACASQCRHAGSAKSNNH